MMTMFPVNLASTVKKNWTHELVTLFETTILRAGRASELPPIVNDPSHDRFYGKKNDRMPSFGRDEKLTTREIEIITDWLRLDWYEGE